MNSESDQHLVRFCPYVRNRNGEDSLRSIQFGELPTTSSLSSHIRPLDWCDNKDGEYDDRYICEVCYKSLARDSFYTCQGCLDNLSEFIRYHKECIEPISNHPYHPRHSLLLQHAWNASTKCQCCQALTSWFYICSICDFIMCRSCAKKPPLLAIDHPKRHDHTLLYFPKIGSSICDFCALSDHDSSMYLCLKCDIVAHKECVYLPFIIRISRHEHRLSFTYSLSPRDKWLLCGVCRGQVKGNYGRYSCVRGCSFGVHSKCATRIDVWDRKELEEIPEDAYEEDVKSYIEISDGIIQHFSHQNHHMQLDEETHRTFDEKKHCQACTLPICNENIYKCMQCDDFILHQACAHLPRKKQNVMHRHPLTLQVDRQEVWYECDACHRKSNGFVYSCDRKDCSNFMLDLCCASIAVPLDHAFHPHALFLTSNPQTQEVCSVCTKSEDYRLNCGECGFVLCFGCASLPNKIRYKYDEHFLIFCYDIDSSSSQNFCDVCEKEADPKKYGIYMCNDCNVTIHIECLLGKDIGMYVLPSRIINNVRGHPDQIMEAYLSVVPNNSLSRYLCNLCHRRCPGKIVYITSDRKIVCSVECVDQSFIKSRVSSTERYDF